SRRAPRTPSAKTAPLGAGLLARERQLLERAQLPEHDAALLLPNQALGLEAPEHGVHLAQAAGGEVGERVLRDAQREHVAAGVRPRPARCGRRSLPTAAGSAAHGGRSASESRDAPRPRARRRGCAPPPPAGRRARPGDTRAPAGAARAPRAARA